MLAGQALGCSRRSQSGHSTVPEAWYVQGYPRAYAGMRVAVHEPAKGSEHASSSLAGWPARTGVQLYLERQRPADRSRLQQRQPGELRVTRGNSGAVPTIAHDFAFPFSVRRPFPSYTSHLVLCIRFAALVMSPRMSFFHGAELPANTIAYRRCRTLVTMRRRTRPGLKRRRESALQRRAAVEAQVRARV